MRVFARFLLGPLALLRGSTARARRADRSTSTRVYQRSRLRIAGVAAHRLAVGASDREIDRLALLVVEAAVAAGDGEARGEPLHVPLERARQRLVEVVEAEDEPAVRRGEDAEVREMRVAAELGVQARPRHAREVGRHQVARRRGRT